MKLVREMYLCKHFMHFHNSTKLCKSRLPVAWKMLHRRREQRQATKLQVAFLACETVQIQRQRDTESRATLGRDPCPCWLGNAWHGLAWQERVSPALAPFALHGYPKNRRTLDGTPEGRPASFSNPSSLHQWTQTKQTHLVVSLTSLTTCESFTTTPGPCSDGITSYRILAVSLPFILYDFSLVTRLVFSLV